MLGDDVDVELFIEEIKQHPVIWDIHCEDYKDRAEKQSAWEDVCKNMFLEFETVSELERATILRKMTLKWKNIKDNYTRSIRKRKNSGQPVKRYIYARQLSFLQESTASATTTASTQQEATSLDYSPCETEESLPSDAPVASCDVATDTPGPSSRAASCWNSSSRRQEFEPSVLKCVYTPPDPTPDSNRSFFDSMLPLIQNFTEDQTLQFRGEVIETIRRIKKQLPTVSNP